MQILISAFKFKSLLAHVTLFSSCDRTFPLLPAKLSELRCKLLTLGKKEESFQAQRLSTLFLTPGLW